MTTLVQRAQREFAMEIIRGREPLTNILPTTDNDARAYLTAVDTMRTHLRHVSAERHEATRRDLVASLRTAVSPKVRAELRQQLEQLRVIDTRRAERRRKQHEARDAADELQTLEEIMMPQLEAEHARRQQRYVRPDNDRRRTYHQQHTRQQRDADASAMFPVAPDA